jgi:hypothetical protein
MYPTHNPEEWILFVFLSKYSLKAVQLHNGNINPSLPIPILSTWRKITRIWIRSWKLWVTRNMAGKYVETLVTGLFLGMQSGYTKFCCCICELDSRAKDKYYKIKDWPMRENSVPREKCQKSTTKVLLLTLHIKFGLTINFVKVVKIW